MNRLIPFLFFFSLLAPTIAFAQDEEAASMQEDAPLRELKGEVMVEASQPLQQDQPAENQQQPTDSSTGGDIDDGRRITE